MDLDTVLQHLQIKRYSSSRSIRLRVGEKGLLVTAPKRVAQREILQFVEQNLGWIAANWQKVVKAKSGLQDGETFLWHGTEMRMLRNESYRKLKLNLEESIFEVPTSFDDAEAVKFLRGQARKYLVARTAILAAQFEFKYNRIAIKDTSSRWGSCSADKNINLSWRLALAPQTVSDYVIIHELAHTVHLDHSDRFWAEVLRCMPDYRMQRLWLKRNSKRLQV
jgi:predicted metal-dependent hydrolase